MKNKIFFITLCLITCIIVLFCTNSSAKHIVDSKSDANQIIGVWRIVEPQLNTEGNQKKVKIITKGHFIWTHTFNNMIVMSLGGTCAFDGEIYTEFIEFGTQNQSAGFGQKVSCKVRFVGNKMYTTTLPGEILIFPETWERVE